jgi:hypothetical protein
MLKKANRKIEKISPASTGVKKSRHSDNLNPSTT